MGHGVRTDSSALQWSNMLFCALKMTIHGNLLQHRVHETKLVNSTN